MSGNFFVPTTPRNPRFGFLKTEDVENMKSYLDDPTTQCLTSYEDILPYCTDWTGKYRSVCLDKSKTMCSQKVKNSDKSTEPDVNIIQKMNVNQTLNTPIVLFPKSTEQVSNLLKYCNHHQFAVSPQSGNTGLAGGSMPVYDEVVINVSKMNKIISFDSSNGVLICEAGCIHADLNEFLKTQSPGFILPYNPSSSPICMIGGNINTNTGGNLMLRYGGLNGNVLGLEVVLPNGSILNSLSTLKKDNTGIKLHQVFIGSEGTLGIVTKVAIQCPLAPKSIQTCFMHCETFSNIMAITLLFKQQMSDIIGGVEYLDHLSYQMVLNEFKTKQDLFGRDKTALLSNMFNYKDSIPQTYYLLLETHGYDKHNDYTRMKAFVNQIVNKRLATRVAFAENETQQANMWFFRYKITEASSKLGTSIYFDLSFPLSYDMDAIVEDIKNKIPPTHPCLVNSLGHIGDGNIHLSVIFIEDQPIGPIEEDLKEFVYKLTIERGGSISSEHGIGIEKTAHFHLIKNSEYINTFRCLKSCFDPNFIMKPYVFFNL